MNDAPWIVSNPTGSEFSVLWDGEMTSISPGEERILPRYLAEHYAKHLTDKVLTERKSLISDEALRKPIESTVMVRPASEEDIPVRDDSRLLAIEERERALASREAAVVLSEERAQSQLKRIQGLADSNEKRAASLDKVARAEKADTIATGGGEK